MITILFRTNEDNLPSNLNPDQFNETNKKGQGIFKITNLRKIGYYIAVITVPTNHYYNKVSKKVKITVKR